MWDDTWFGVGLEALEKRKELLLVKETCVKLIAKELAPNEQCDAAPLRIYLLNLLTGTILQVGEVG
jgi:hypothetical protein